MTSQKLRELFVIITCGVFLLTAGCSGAGQNAPLPKDDISDARNFARPYALESLGYCLDVPEDIGICDPNGDWVGTFPPYQIKTKETTNSGTMHSDQYVSGVSGGLSLYGEMTVIRVACDYDAINDDGNCCCVILQTFKNEELAQPNVQIPFLQPYARGNLSLRHVFGRSLQDVEEYKVYSDESITVYDFFLLSEAPPLEDQLRAVAEQDKLDERGIHYLWLLEVDTYFRDITKGGVGRFIKPMPEE